MYINKDNQEHISMSNEDLLFDSKLHIYKYDPDYDIIKKILSSDDISYRLWFEDDYTKAYTGKYQTESLSGTVFPSKLKTLYIMHEYNVCLCSVNLPDTIEELILDGKYNQPLNCIKYPKNLKYLELGSEYNQCLTDVVFPENLQTICFKNTINKNFINIKLPNGLKKIIINTLYISHIKYLNMPENLKKITIVHYITKNNIDKFIGEMQIPKNLKTLKIDGYKSLPLSSFKNIENIKIISFGSGQILTEENLMNLPYGLEELHLHKSNVKLFNLPIGLKILKFCTERGNVFSKPSLLKDIVKLPFGCYVVDKFNNKLDLDTSYV